jgi:hypothetical protein
MVAAIQITSPERVISPIECQLSQLMAKVKYFIEKNPYLETNLPRCKLVSEGFYRLLVGYNTLIIHAGSKMLSSTSREYDHWFLQIKIDHGTYILDGTYRQFFEGGKENPENDNKRLLLPKYFFGNLRDLYELFRINKELLISVFVKNLKRSQNVSTVVDFHIVNLINELYGQYLEPPEEVGGSWNSASLSPSFVRKNNFTGLWTNQ